MKIEERITRSCDYGATPLQTKKITRAASSSKLTENEADVVEGFLCPICKCDLGRPDYLQVHFERSHLSSEDQLNGSFDLRSMISRAKSRVLRSLEDSAQVASFDLPGSSAEPNGPLEPPARKPLALVTRDRTKMFLAFRDQRATYRASRSQQVLSRLNRLTSLDVNGANKRRVLERHITPWADDRDISRCPTCAQAFGFLRRKHHCRLCGFIMCNQCSLFLSVDFAVEFLQSVRTREDDRTSADGSVVDDTPLKRVDSLTSLNSIGGADPRKFIRLCADCRRVLKERYECVQDEQVASASVLPSYYEQLSCAVRALQTIKANLFASSPPRASGAASNEETPSPDLLERQVSLEMNKIHSLLTKIDSVLKGEAAENGGGGGLTPAKRKIAEALKSYGILAIHDGLTWRGKLNGKAERRSAPPPRQGSPDPIVEQIAQVKRFIEIAKNGQRYDEVWALEANLRELELMLRKMRT